MLKPCFATSSGEPLLRRMFLWQLLLLLPSDGFLARVPVFHYSVHCSCCGRFRRYLRRLAIFLLFYLRSVDLCSAAPQTVSHTPRFERIDLFTSCHGRARPLLMAHPLPSSRSPYASFFSSEFALASPASVYLGSSRRSRSSLKRAAPGLLLCVPSRCCHAAHRHEEDLNKNSSIYSAVLRRPNGGLGEFFRPIQSHQSIAASMTRSSKGLLDDLRRLRSSLFTVHRRRKVVCSTADCSGTSGHHPVQTNGHCICSQTGVRKVEKGVKIRNSGYRSTCLNSNAVESSESPACNFAPTSEDYSVRHVKSGTERNVEPLVENCRVPTSSSTGVDSTWCSRGPTRRCEGLEFTKGSCFFEESTATEILCSLPAEPHEENSGAPPEALRASQQSDSGSPSNGSSSGRRSARSVQSSASGSSCARDGSDEGDRSTDRHEEDSKGSACTTHPKGKGILTWLSDAVTRARLEQLVETTNMLLEQQGSTNRLYLVMPLTRKPSPDSFSFGHLMEGDKASFPRKVLSQILERRLDPPWHFLIEKVHDSRIENAPTHTAGALGVPAVAGGRPADSAASDGDFRPADADSEDRTNVGEWGSSSTSQEQAGALAHEGDAAGVADVNQQPRRISVGVLDFQAPSNFIFLPLWIMKALRLRPMSVVACSWVRLPLAEHVTFQPLEPGFLAAATGSGQDIQRSLEEELRHYSSLTAKTTIPLRLRGKVFHLKVAKLKPEKNGGALQTLDGGTATRESAAALEAIPLADGSEHVCVQDTDVSTTLLSGPQPS